MCDDLFFVFIYFRNRRVKQQLYVVLFIPCVFINDKAVFIHIAAYVFHEPYAAVKRIGLVREYGYLSFMVNLSYVDCGSCSRSAIADDDVFHANPLQLEFYNFFS